MSEARPWSYLDKMLDELEDYYGMHLSRSFKSSIKNDIVNELVESVTYELPKEVCAKCVDGSIYKGKPTDGMQIELVALRDKYPKRRMGVDDWEVLLAKYSEPKYAYCFDNKTLYNDIEPLVGKFLMKHKCSDKIYNLVSGLNFHMSITDTLLIDLLDIYIIKEGKIREKLEMFKQSMEDMDNITPWKYISNLLSKDKNLSKLDNKTLNTLMELAKEKDIVYNDLVYRVRTGMCIEDAVREGQIDCEKYGFKCELVAQSYNSSPITGTRYNIIMYIRYKAKQEQL